MEQFPASRRREVQTTARILRYGIAQRYPYEEYFWQYAAESGFYPLLIKQRKQYGDSERKADRENLKKLLARAERIADGDGVKFSDVVGSRFVENNDFVRDSGFVRDSSDAVK